MGSSEAELEDFKCETKNNRLIHLPMARVKTIMKSSPDLGNVSQEAYFLITKATECFVQYMAEEAWKSAKDKRTVDYKQLGNKIFIFNAVFNLLFENLHKNSASRSLKHLRKGIYLIGQYTLV